MYERRPGFFRDDAPSGRRVEARVKWFSASKGFGFVSPSDGSQDAFLPMAVLRRAGFEELRDGASISCEVGVGAKGPLVTGVLSVDNGTAIGQSAGRSGRAGGFERRVGGNSATVEGVVKRFDPGKGYGFIAPDGGGKDVFIHITALRRSGVAALETGQRVRVEVVDGTKGQEAERVTLI